MTDPFLVLPFAGMFLQGGDQMEWVEFAVEPTTHIYLQAVALEDGVTVDEAAIAVMTAALISVVQPVAKHKEEG
jgi:hypothetical protein